jgi:hypothetical protein
MDSPWSHAGPRAEAMLRDRPQLLWHQDAFVAGPDQGGGQDLERVARRCLPVRFAMGDGDDAEVLVGAVVGHPPDRAPAIALPPPTLGSS